MQGKLLLRFGADKYLGQIIFFFAMAATFIGVNLGMEKTLHQMEENKLVLENLKSIYVQYKCEITSLNSVCKVEEMLKEKGSEVIIPEKRAITLE